MRPDRTAAAVVLLLAGALMFGRPAASAAAAFVPSDDRDVLEQLPGSPLDPSARRLRTLHAALAKHPDNLGLATEVAWLYIAQGRALSDPRYYSYAQAALTPWWNVATPPAAVLVLRATIRQRDHEFAAALDDLAQALDADPDNAQAWLIRSVVLQVRGEYDEAKRGCLEVLKRSSVLIAVTCLSNVQSLSGQAASAYDRLRQALTQASEDDATAYAWALTALAEIAVRRGHPQAADAHFKDALGRGNTDNYLLSAYADFLLDQGRAAEVRDLLQNQIRADALLLRLALAEAELAAPEQSQHVQMLADRFAAARLRGDAAHRREEARFALRLADQPQVALKLAQENWEVQREPADARILLESALVTGTRMPAQSVLDFLARTGLEDVTLARLAAQLEGLPR